MFVKMPQQKSPSTEQPSGTTALRRSPRLLPKDRTAPGDPKTPEPKSRVGRVPHLHRYPLRSERKGSLKKGHKNCPAEAPKKVIKKSKCGLKISDKLDSDLRISPALKRSVFLRRSPRFSGNQNTYDEFVEKKSPDKCSQGGFSNLGKGKVCMDRCKQVVVKTEKRVTRSSTKGNPDENVKRTKKTNMDNCNARIKSASIEVSEKEDLPSVEKAEVGSNSCKRFGGKLNKRKSISGAKKGKCSGFMKSASPEVLHGDYLPNVERARVGGDSCKRTEAKLEKRWTRSSGAPSVVTDGGEENEEIDLYKGMKVIGVKRKRNQVKEGHGIVQAWTKDQELALQGAYFAVKPTPHFWKKVAKLVPGKSAQDCFDKVHADHLTPSQPRRRPRVNKTKLSSFPRSASKLLKSGPKMRRPSGRRLKTHLAQKTVRQLLERHYNVDQDYEADLFSVLESTSSNPSTEAFQQGGILSTPEPKQEEPAYLKKCCERSSLVHKKQVSRLRSSDGATLVSPPVLKQVKNRALHEKFIDQLHYREAKRRAASARAAKSISGKENRMENSIKKLNAIKAAKNALVLDANDVIHQFQHLKASVWRNSSNFDDDDDGVERYDDESEDEP